MKRLALAVGWLAVTYLGTFLVAQLQAPYRPPWYFNAAVAFAPLAALLAWLVRDRGWALVIIAGLAALAVLEHVSAPLLSALVRPLAPAPAFPPPPRVDYLPVELVYGALFGLLVGLVELAVLWPYLKPSWMLPVYKTVGGALTGFALYWQLYLPLPGAPNSRFSWPPALVGAIAVALLWRFGIKAPQLRVPRIHLPPPVEDEVDPAYAAWIEDLESSLQPRP